MRGFGRLAALLAAVALVLCACAPLVEDEGPQAFRVYATFYPLYALTQLVTDGVPSVELNCLVRPQDGCLRDYALSDRDAYLLQYADAVVIGGRGLESFESTLYALGADGPAVLATLYNLELINQDDTRASDDEDASHLIGANPHLYLSVDGARAITEVLAFEMAELKPEYADLFMANLDAAEERLDALEAEMAEVAAGAAGATGATGKGVILLNEALSYTARDLKLTVAGQLDRESGEGLYGADLEGALQELAQMGARVVLIEKQAPKALMDALEDAGYAVAKIDILSTGREDMGADGYFDAQRRNAQAVARAFAEAEGSN